MKLSTGTKIGLGVFAAVGLIGIYTINRASAAAGAVGDAVNPVNPENIFAQGINALGDSLDDGVRNDSFSLGTWLYDITHPFEPDTTQTPTQEELMAGGQTQ